MSDQKEPREFWIDDILNVDRPNQKVAHIHYDDIESHRGKTIHVIEKSAYDKLKAKNEKLQKYNDELFMHIQDRTEKYSIAMNKGVDVLSARLAECEKAFKNLFDSISEPLFSDDRLPYVEVHILKEDLREAREYFKKWGEK